jgi:hypothetical protein
VPKGSSRVRLLRLKFERRACKCGGRLARFKCCTHAGITAHKSVQATHALFQLIKSDSTSTSSSTWNKVRLFIDVTCCALASRVAQAYGSDDWKEIAIDIVKVQQVTCSNALACFSLILPLLSSLLTSNSD